jgi:hypothetical protein
MTEAHDTAATTNIWTKTATGDIDAATRTATATRPTNESEESDDGPRRPRRRQSRTSMT